jgi:RNA polymerase sigma-70 factor (ECF subfamily)
VSDALSELGGVYDTYAPKIFRYIYHRLGDQSLAEDLTSEVFVRFLNARVAPNNLAAFLYRIAHNLIVDYLRQHPPALSLDEDVPSDGGDPAQLAEIEMERVRLRRALHRLASEQQQVIVLKFLEGLSNEEIARVIDKPVGAVKALQHRGLATLRDLLGAELRRAAPLEQVERVK